MDMNGSRIIVGTRYGTGPGGEIHNGYAEVFNYDGDNVWRRVGSRMYGNVQAYAYFGHTVSMANSGTRVAVGAPNYGADAVRVSGGN
jgi:hypothetical protein